MSEDATSPPPDANPHQEGWQQVAITYRDWDPALHGPVERLLAQNGIAPPGAEIPADPVFDIGALKDDVAISAYMYKFNQGMNGNPNPEEPPVYGTAACNALLDAGEVDRLLLGLQNERFRLPFWPTVCWAGVISFVIYKLTGNTSVPTLLFVLVLILALIKAVFLSFRVMAWFVKAFLVAFILLAWLNIFLSVVFK